MTRLTIIQLLRLFVSEETYLKSRCLATIGDTHTGTQTVVNYADEMAQVS